MFRRTPALAPQLPAGQLAAAVTGMSQVSPPANIKQSEDAPPVPDPPGPSRFQRALAFVISHRYEAAYCVVAGVIGYVSAPRNVCYLM